MHSTDTYSTAMNLLKFVAAYHNMQRIFILLCVH